jgi:hypothetical protein
MFNSKKNHHKIKQTSPKKENPYQFSAKTDLPIEIFLEDRRRSFFGRIIELSVEGASVQSIVDISSGERIEIEMKISHSFIKLQTKVVKSTGKMFYVIFLDLSRSEESLLIDFIYNEQTGRLNYT